MTEDMSEYVEEDSDSLAITPEFTEFEAEVVGVWNVPETHWHVFICLRNPNVHQGRVPCHEVLVICPKCGSAGDMVVVTLNTE